MSDGKPTRQDEQREPVVEDPRLPTMATEPPSPPERGRRMADNPKATPGGKRLMEPVPKKRPRASTRKLDDMGPPRRGGGAPEGGQSYVRLQVRAEGDRLTVIGIRSVDGPLIAQEEHIGGELAFEATVGKRRVALGSLPDAGTLRSFPSPDGPPELQVHNLIEPESFEFTVRVPGDDLPRSALKDLAITLYRVKGTPTEQVKGPEPLTEQLHGALRPIARLEGITPGALAPDVRQQLKRALG
jgi:hypothetical protein